MTNMMDAQNEVNQATQAILKKGKRKNTKKDRKGKKLK